MADRIQIFDTTLRDGEQSPGCSMNIDEKLRMAHQLERLGVDVIEAGFPIASEGDFQAVYEIAQSVRTCAVAGLCRAVELDIDRGVEALEGAAHPVIHTFIATSDIHMKHKLKMSRDEVLRDAAHAVSHARKSVARVEFSAEDACRSHREFLVEVLTAAAEAGATVLNVPDTVGYITPREYTSLIEYLMERLPLADGVILSTHCHNDLGLAVANSLAGVLAGARQVECTINGIGERAGNASLEEFAMVLKTRADQVGLSTTIKSEEIFPTSRLLSNITGVQVQPNKAIVGRNAFAHEAGIHQHGVLSNTLTYEIMTPQSVGIQKNQIVLGKHSGRHALAKRYADLGFTLSQEELNQVYQLFCDLADKKKDIYDEDLIAIVNDEVSGVPESFTLVNLQVNAGSRVIPTATITLASSDGDTTDSATGDGPVDATYRAIDRITEFPGKLVDYQIHSVTTGKDAVGEVHVRVNFGGDEYHGRSASTDIVEGSARAYLDALNRAFYAQQRVAGSEQRRAAG